MTVLHLLRDGALLAAELVALLAVPPAAAGESAAPVTAPPTHVELHALASAIDVRLLDSVASVRVVQTVRNDGPAALQLAPHLPVADPRVDRLRIVRAGRSVGLLGAGDDCDTTAPDMHAGRAQTTPDELHADLLTLPAGAQATIDIVAVDTVERGNGTVPIALPVTSVPLPARAWLLPGDTPQLVIVPPPEARGAATLTVRPAHGATEVVPLGTLSSALIVVPLATPMSARQLEEGAIELETVETGRVRWTTLPFMPAAAVVTADAGR